jgi:hypothetical protein
MAWLTVDGISQHCNTGKYTSDACVYGYPYAANGTKTDVNVVSAHTCSHCLITHVGKYTSDKCVYEYPYTANGNKTDVNVELIEVLGEARALALSHRHSNRLAWCYYRFLQWLQLLAGSSVTRTNEFTRNSSGSDWNVL